MFFELLFTPQQLLLLFMQELLLLTMSFVLTLVLLELIKLLIFWLLHRYMRRMVGAMIQRHRLGLMGCVLVDDSGLWERSIVLSLIGIKGLASLLRKRFISRGSGSSRSRNGL